MELLNIFGLAVAETVETSEAGKYRLPQLKNNFQIYNGKGKNRFTF